MPDFLVDANVLVYSVDSSEADKQERAIAALRQLDALGHIVLSAQSLSEFYSASTRRLRVPLSRDEAGAMVIDWSRAWPVYPVTVTAVREAVIGSQRHQMSYWDSLIWAVAKLNGVPNVLTEDVQSSDLIEGVRFVNPFAPDFDFAMLG